MIKLQGLEEIWYKYHLKFDKEYKEFISKLHTEYREDINKIAPGDESDFEMIENLLRYYKDRI